MRVSPPPNFLEQVKEYDCSRQPRVYCVDYHRLNALTSKDVFLLPRINDILDQVSGKCIFLTLNARTGYWQIKVHEYSCEKTAFVTMDGFYEFRVMPFGLRNAPATFQINAEDSGWAQCFL